MKLTRSVALCAAALSAAALTACTAEGGAKESAAPGEAGKPAVQQRSAAAVMAAATEQTSEAGSARVEMTVDAPGEGGDAELKGVTGWNPTAMDVTVSGAQLAAVPGGAAEDVRMLWRDDVMYVDAGQAAAAQLDGKRWMTFDLGALTEGAGDASMMGAMTSSLRDVQQSPAQQMGMLLKAEDIRFAGEERVDGVATRHYRGSLTMREALEANTSLDFLTGDERAQLLDAMKSSGVDGYDIEAWVNGDDMPVRLDMTMDGPEGKTSVSQKLSDFGTDLAVQPPPAAETFDLMSLLKQLQDAGADAGSDAPSGTGARSEAEAELQELTRLEELRGTA